MAKITHPVGDCLNPRVRNHWEDVETVQKLLKAASKKTGNSSYDPILADGIILPYLSHTVNCIKAFQSRFMKNPDGIISPGRKTINMLSEFESISEHLPPTPSYPAVSDGGCCYPLARRPTNSYKKPTNGRHFRGTYFGATRKNKRGYRKHAGCDLKAPQGTPIYAVDDGKVLSLGRKFISGKRKNGEEWAVGSIVVEHSNFVVRYAETETNFPTDQFEKINGKFWVKKGQKIAEIGKMNVSSMLHFEMYSGTAKGRLTQYCTYTKEFGKNTSFMRRADLIDPTPYLDRWITNMPTS